MAGNLLCSPSTLCLDTLFTSSDKKNIWIHPSTRYRIRCGFFFSTLAPSTRYRIRCGYIFFNSGERIRCRIRRIRVDGSRIRKEKVADSKISGYVWSGPKSRQLIKRYCKADLDITLAFSTFKLRNMFSVKDSVPQGLRSRVVYSFSCAGCNTSYIGETTRLLCTRVREHFLSDKSSYVYRHLQSSRAGHDSCDTECFTILDSAASKF